MSTRRAFSISLFALAGDAPILGFAQPRTGQRRIAYLGATSLAASRELIEALISGLRDLGYVDGSNLIFDMRFAEGDLARLHALMEEQLALRPDIVVASTDTTARPVAALTKTIPIVLALVHGCPRRPVG